MTSGPVFVAGLERSGTSLLYALLASHPNIAMTRRTNLWTYFNGRYGDLGDPANLERCLDVMMRYKRIVKLAPDRARLVEDFTRGEPTYGRLFALLERQHADRLGKPRWGDKSLHTERYAGPIFLAYPDARILHMLRDPRDRFASVRTRWGDRLGGLGGATAEWLSSVRLAERNLAAGAGRYLLIRYEDLVSSPEETTRRICSFIGEDFAPEMMAMGGAAEFNASGGNSSYGPREAGAIATDSVARYRQKLTARQVAFIQLVAGRAMERHGYPADRLELTPVERGRFLLGDLPLELARAGAWRAREAMRDRKGRQVPGYRLVAVEQPV